MDQQTRVNPKPYCACRCGFLVNHPRSTFLPGHDARMVSVALRDLRMRVRSDDWTGGKVVTRKLYQRWATDIAVDRFGERWALRQKFGSAADRQWTRITKGIDPGLL